MHSEQQSVGRCTDPSSRQSVGLLMDESMSLNTAHPYHYGLMSLNQYKIKVEPCRAGRRLLFYVKLQRDWCFRSVECGGPPRACCLNVAFGPRFHKE
jgi:hypothetical protein